jgi:hypothetical protein
MNLQSYANCHNCNFCLVRTDPNNIGRKVGECHGNPPVTTISNSGRQMGIMTVFPVVGDDPRSICRLHQNFNLVNFKALESII